MKIKSVTVTKKNAYPRDKDIISFFQEKGLYENTDEFKQWEKLEEEVYELLEALQGTDKKAILSEAGDTYVCLVNVLHCLGFSMGQAVDEAVDKVVKRKGEVVEGKFVKEVR